MIMFISTVDDVNVSWVSWVKSTCGVASALHRKRKRIKLEQRGNDLLFTDRGQRGSLIVREPLNALETLSPDRDRPLLGFLFSGNDVLDQSSDSSVIVPAGQNANSPSPNAAYSEIRSKKTSFPDVAQKPPGCWNEAASE